MNSAEEARKIVSWGWSDEEKLEKLDMYMEWVRERPEKVRVVAEKFPPGLYWYDNCQQVVELFSFDEPEDEDADLLAGTGYRLGAYGHTPVRGGLNLASQGRALLLDANGHGDEYLWCELLTDDEGVSRVIGRRWVQTFNTTYNLPPFGGIDWPIANHIMFAKGCTDPAGYSTPPFDDPQVRPAAAAGCSKLWPARCSLPSSSCCASAALRRPACRPRRCSAGCLPAASGPSFSRAGS